MRPLKGWESLNLHNAVIPCKNKILPVGISMVAQQAKSLPEVMDFHISTTSSPGCSICNPAPW